MKNRTLIRGFSKYNKEQRIDFLIERYGWSEEVRNWLYEFESDDVSFQTLMDELTENSITNYHIPFSIAPNFLVDGVFRTFPLVTEESSVVAALGKAAGFWAEHGGFHTRIIGTEKKGQVHFKWNGASEKLQKIFPQIRAALLRGSESISKKMTVRGGGIMEISLLYLPHILPNYYQLDVSFETLDAMGANFINSVLEQMSRDLQSFFSSEMNGEEAVCEIIMAILSNYTPACLVQAWMECSSEKLDGLDNISDFAQKFSEAVHIAQNDISRAVTHNKGIMNGVDALSIATGNDFRAMEASVHAFAARSGRYTSLTEVQLQNGMFRFTIELPLAVGVVGGVTAVHPLSAFSLKILDNPSAAQLMGYLAVAGLASNFSAIRALIGSGIQRGHMKMHLSNILHQLNASDEEKVVALNYFASKPVSYSEVKNFLIGRRNAGTID